MAAASSASETSNDAENRIVGMMVGSAVADAIGIYTDSLTKEKINEEYNTRRRIIASYKANELTPHYPDEHRAQYEDGSWSEVTEMALCSLFCHLHDENQEKLPGRLRHLSRNGNRAYGLLRLHLGQPITDIIEANDFLTKGGARKAATAWWAQNGRGRTDMDGSNAPLVRLHPVAAFAAQKNLGWSFLQANENCRATHVDSRCSISVLVAISLLRGLIRREVQTEDQINPLIQRCKRQIDYWQQKATPGGKEVPDNFKGAYYLIQDPAELSQVLTIQSLKDLELDKSGGKVYKCLGAGVFCLRTAMVRLGSLSGQAREDHRKVLFAEIINNLVLQGGAAQANAAFAGALLGAYLGYDAIPQQAIRGLSNRKFLMGKCKLLCEWVGVIRGEGGEKKRKERDFGLVGSRSRSERRAMASVIKDRREARLKLLQKRWKEKGSIMSERRRTVYGSLKFPPKGI